MALGNFAIDALADMIVLGVQTASSTSLATRLMSIESRAAQGNDAPLSQRGSCPRDSAGRK